MIKFSTTAFIVATSIFLSCNSNKPSSVISDVDSCSTLQFTPLYNNVYDDTIIESAVLPGLLAWAEVTGIDTTLSLTEIVRIEREMSDPFVDDVNRAFTSTDIFDLGYDISNALKRLNELLSDSISTPQHLYGVIWPYRQSIAIVDTVALVALNHYLGPNHEAYSGFDTQIAATKDFRYITTDLVTAILRTSHPFKTPNPPTLLQAMLYEGAITYSTLPAIETDSPFNIIPSSNPHETVLNAPEAWRYLVDNELLYSTNPEVINNLLTSAYPRTNESPYLNRSTIRYISYQIVSDFVVNDTSLSLSRILSTDFYGDPNLRLTKTPRFNSSLK